MPLIVMLIALVLSNLLLLSNASTGSGTNSSQPGKLSPFLLTNNGTDMCLKQNRWDEGKIECLQVLLELYYGSYRYICPNMAELFAGLGCRECPWNRLNASLIESTPEIKRTQVAHLFQKAGQECRVAQVISDYARSEEIEFRLWVYGGNAAVLILVASFLLTLDTKSSVQNFVFKGRPIPESMFMCTVWLIFTSGHILFNAAHFFYDICDNYANSLAFSVAHNVGYCAMLLASFVRYSRLEASFATPETRSWSAFVANNAKQGTFSRKLCLAVYYCGPIFVAISAFLDIHPAFWFRWSLCSTGIASRRFGIYQYGKLALEVLALTAYCAGPQTNIAKHGIRMILLGFSGVMGLVLLAIWFALPTIVPASTSIAGIFDAQVSGSFIEIAHTLFVVLLGLMESLRLERKKEDGLESSNEDFEVTIGITRNLRSRHAKVGYCR